MRILLIMHIIWNFFTRNKKFFVNDAALLGAYVFFETPQLVAMFV